MADPSYTQAMRKTKRYKISKFPSGLFHVVDTLDQNYTVTAGKPSRAALLGNLQRLNGVKTRTAPPEAFGRRSYKVTWTEHRSPPKFPSWPAPIVRLRCNQCSHSVRLKKSGRAAVQLARAAMHKHARDKHRSSLWTGSWKDGV